MFIGHYAVGFAGRAALRSPGARPSLGTWFLAVQWLDLVWPVFVMLGIERLEVKPTGNPFLNLAFTYYPWTHSLLAAIAWSGAFAAVYHSRTRNLKAAVWLAGAVLSHWVLDFIVHIPDLPVYPGGRLKLGAGLWRSAVATIAIESTMFVFAVAWYLRRTRNVDRAGHWGFWALIGFLVAAYIGSVLGPPPPGPTAVGVSALLLWLLAPWAYWIDRHRADRAERT